MNASHGGRHQGRVRPQAAARPHGDGGGRRRQALKPTPAVKLCGVKPSRLVRTCHLRRAMKGRSTPRRRISSASSAASGSAPPGRRRQARPAPHARPGARNPVSTGSRAWPVPAAASCRAGTASTPSPAPARWAWRPRRAAPPRCCCASRTPRWSRSCRQLKARLAADAVRVRARQRRHGARARCRRQRGPGLPRPAVRRRPLRPGAARRCAALAPEGVVYLEAPVAGATTNWPRSGLVVCRHLKAGAVHAHLLSRPARLHNPPNQPQRPIRRNHHVQQT